MNKKILAILALVLSICMLVFTFTACGTDDDDDRGRHDSEDEDNENDGENGGEDGGGDTEGGEDHVHSYIFESPSSDCIAAAATCKSSAKYYISCICGAHGTSTFEYGEPASCEYENGACKWCGEEEPLETEGLIFTEIKNGSAYMLSGYEGTAAEVYIPSTHNGKPVTRIVSYAFKENTTVTSVTIGGNITHIDNDAFADCSNLRTVVIGNDVQEIGNSAFSWCGALENVKLPDSLTIIGESAFWMCASLKSVEIPYGVTTIRNSAFGRCDALTGIFIPATVTTIEDKAFYWCINLENINVDSKNPSYSSVQGNLYSKDQTVILQYAIGKKNTDFAIPTSVTTIGYLAFAYSSNLVNLEIPNSVTYVDYGVFSDVSGLKYNTKGGLNYLGNEQNPYLYLVGPESKAITAAVIDADCRFIGDFAFSFCTYLTDVTFEKNCKLQKIGSCAFFYCDALSSITIPSSVTHIDSSFYACPILGSIVFEDANGWYVTDSRDSFNTSSNGTAISVTDGALNSTNFMETYIWHYWYKLS
jgi:hypothetical protein